MYIWINNLEEPQFRTVSLLKRTSEHIVVQITGKSILQLRKNGWRCAKVSISITELKTTS